MRQWRTRLLLAGMVTVLVVAGLPAVSSGHFPSPSLPLPQPAPAGDPRLAPIIARIRAGLEKAGLRVLDVRFEVRTEPQWVAEAAATYAQPSLRAVVWQAFTTWGALYAELSQEPPTECFWDLERRQCVNGKDFVNKHYAR